MHKINIIKDIVLKSKHDNTAFGLDAFFKDNQSPKPVIVFIHGFNGFKDWGHFNLIAEYFAQNDFCFVKFNLSHNGTTLLRPTEIVDLNTYGNDKFSTDLDDTGLVLNYLCSKDCIFSREMDLNRLFLVGHSRGGGIAILKAGEDARIKALATWSSIISTRHFWTPEHIEEVEKKGVVYVNNSRTQQKLPLYYAYYEDVLLNPKRLNTEEAMKNLKIPAFISHGTADTSLPLDFIHQLKNWKPDAEQWIAEGATHTYGGFHPYDKLELPEQAKILCEKTADFFKLHSKN